MGLYREIAKLVEYGLQTGLVVPADTRYTINQLLEIFKEDEYEVRPQRSLCFAA